MPKEKINQSRRFVSESATLTVLNNGLSLDGPLTSTSAGTPISSEPPVSKDGPVVQVGWHKDSWVQVSIEGDCTYFQFAAENPDGETSDRSTVYSEPMNRDELNKLIRVLRRARDQVYGRDE